jgi:hypothetical protein
MSFRRLVPSGRRLLLPAVAASMLLVPASASAARKPASPATYDVSYPQCSASLPAPIDGGIVGVNNGIVLSANPCLAREYAWAASGTKYGAAFYANTGNPGAAVSGHWPTGQQSPQVCDASAPDSTSCSYDYGWNAARDSFNDAAAVTTTAASHAWWLDVETGNSWETLESQYGQTASAKANDIAALQGEVAGLQSDGVATIGVYSTSYQWTQITGGTGTAFGAQPAWIAGTGSLSTAKSNCLQTSFTGGPITLTQYAKSGYDADYHC